MEKKLQKFKKHQNNIHLEILSSDAPTKTWQKVRTVWLSFFSLLHLENVAALQSTHDTVSLPDNWKTKQTDTWLPSFTCQENVQCNAKMNSNEINNPVSRTSTAYFSVACRISAVHVIRSSLELVWISYISGIAVVHALIRNMALSLRATSRTMSLCREITAGLFSCGGKHKCSTHVVTIGNRLSLDGCITGHGPWLMRRPGQNQFFILASINCGLVFVRK